MPKITTFRSPRDPSQQEENGPSITNDKMYIEGEANTRRKQKRRVQKAKRRTEKAKRLTNYETNNRKARRVF